MKKIALLLFVTLISISCSMNDDFNDYYYGIIPVESFELPASFELGQVYTITLFYKIPTNCHSNPTLYFEKDGKTRTIAIQSVVANRANCEAVPEEVTKELKFQFEVTSSTPYLFKFYKGNDENDEAIYDEVTVTVDN
jgi:hypothetical protein